MAENERKAEIEARVAEKKAEWEARKQKYKGNAIKISNEILKGIDFSEEAYVKLVNGTFGEVTIRPLAEGEMMEVLSQVGLEALEGLDKKAEFKSEDYDFFWIIASVSTGLDKELIKKTFAIGESATLANRILEMSGFTPETEEEIEGF